MSGGRFNYMDSSLMDEIFGYSSKPRDVFEDMEISQLVWDVLELVHSFDLYASDDTGEDDWLKAKAKFRKKWFETARKDRLKKIIDEKVEETRMELYKTIGVKVDTGGDG